MRESKRHGNGACISMAQHRWPCQIWRVLQIEASFRGARSVNRNLEIPRCAIAHLRSGPEPVIGPRCARTRWDRPGNDVGAKKRPACASLLRYRCVLSAAMAATMVLPAARSELDRLQLDAGDAGCDVQSGLALHADRLQRVDIRRPANQKVAAKTD